MTEKKGHREFDMRFQHLIYCILLLFTACAMRQTDANVRASAFKEGARWQDTTVRLLVADAPKTDGRAFQEVKAKWATYELTPEIKSKLTPRAPYTTVPDKLEIVTFHDPHTKKVIFINKHQFYVSRPEGVTGFRPFLWQLWHYDSFMELAGLSGLRGEAADIEFFEKTFDVQKAVSAMIGPYEERVIHFKHAMPDGYFNNDHQLFPSELKNAEMTKGVLRIDLWNPLKKTPASVWFDLDAKKVIRSQVDGVEMEVADEKAVYAVPKEPDPQEHPWSGVYYRNDNGGALPDVAINTPVTLTLLPNDGLPRRGDGALGTYVAKKPEQVAIRSTRLLTALWLSRKNHGMEMVYVPVAWGGRKYLVATNEMIEFCVAVNAGSEPRKGRFGKFLLHEGDERIKVTGWPEVPLKYRQYLLKEPIVATITKVGNISGGLPIAQFNSVQVGLDKGKQAGVLEGMEFYYLPQSGYGKIKVRTVSDNSAEAVAEFFEEKGMRPESGREVSTRFQPRPVPFSGEAEAQWELLDESEAQFQSPFFPAPRIKSR